MSSLKYIGSPLPTCFPPSAPASIGRSEIFDSTSPRFILSQPYLAQQAAFANASMDPFTPLDQSNTSFTSPITDFNMDGWPTDADVWNTFYNFHAFPVVQPSGFANQGVGDGFQ